MDTPRHSYLKKELNADNLQKIINNKIQQIKSSDDYELPESKIDLIDFYYKISIKLLNEIDKSDILDKKKTEQELLKNISSKNQIFQQDSHFIIERQEDINKNRFNASEKQGLINYNINPFKREFLTKIVNNCV